MIGPSATAPRWLIHGLWSVAQLKLPITFVILKNRRYAALQEFAPRFGFKPGETLPGTALPDIDFVTIARGHGCKGVHVESADALRGVLVEALHSADPIVVEVEVA